VWTASSRMEPMSGTAFVKALAPSWVIGWIRRWRAGREGGSVWIAGTRDEEEVDWMGC